jgi:hypothetical protein
MYRVQIEIPEDADPKVVEALKAAAHALSDDAEHIATASPNSYSLTVHVLPDEKE